MYKPYKILALTTSMEYGGAETHILELSKYLKSNGADIKIISNATGGDLFEREITSAGIEHISAPFHSRNIFDMRKAAKILKNFIKSYKPDVVHAHSRIPAFIATGICKKLKIPLVTTIHGTYKISPLLKLATKWGDYSLYVSDDIKNYWRKYFKLKNGCMFKTVNGINTELFCRGDDQAQPPAVSVLRQEFGISPEEKIILTVGRLENRGGFDLSFTAVKLCEISREIYDHDKNTRIIIVGDGENFTDIKAKAREINEELGFEYIIMPGRRADAYKFFAACTVFTGVSRSALEAISCGKPVIMCSAMGYLGRFAKENARDCENTNFTCRGFEHPENINKVLLGEILFALDPENKNALEADAKFGADMVREKYSVEKMADDAYAVYKKAALKYKDYDFVLGGYYGDGNIGDDALLFSVVSNILQKKSELKICLLTTNTKKMQNWIDKYFCNITTKYRFNLPGVKKAVKKSKALVFGGGTLLQDSTSSRSFGYYSWLLKTAQRLGKKTVLYANGIGPIYHNKNQKKAEKIVRGITLATIRDEDSYNYLIRLGMDKSRVHLTADEAVTINQNNYFDPYKKDFREYLAGRAAPGAAQPPAGDYVVVSVRKWKYLKSDFFVRFAAAMDIICREHALIPVYIVMQPKNDKLLSERLSALNGRAYFANVGGDIEKTLTIIRSAQAVISMRLHTLIFAAAFGVPALGISYDPKVGSFLNSVFGGDGYTVELKDFSKDSLTDKFKVLMSNKESVREQINKAAERLYEKAALNAELFFEIIREETDHETDTGD
jgi:polysaccharide pyruvyl transferase CsaB